RDIERSRFEKWAASASAIKRLLSGHEDFAADAVPDQELTRDDLKEIQALWRDIRDAVSDTKDAIHARLALHHVFETLHKPVEEELAALCQQGVRRLAAEVDKRPLQEAFVHLFGQIVEDLPHRLSLALDNAISGFLAHLDEIVPEERFAFGSARHAANGGGNGKPHNGAAANGAGPALRDRVYDALVPPQRVWKCEHLRRPLRRKVDECLDRCWTRPLRDRSPMRSVPNEPFDRDAHPRRFERIARRVGEQIMTTAVVAAARDVIQETRERLLRWLDGLEAQTSLSTLKAQAYLSGADNPDATAARRRALAGRAFQEFQQALPDVLARLNAALEPPAQVPPAQAAPAGVA
ncbi:MAG: hypothetical protein K2V38_05585, partial [Gemmataceae bacterium]|nr:hypothetical protein [Gemmataceae bacterium]